MMKATPQLRTRWRHGWGRGNATTEDNQIRWACRLIVFLYYGCRFWWDLTGSGDFLYCGCRIWWDLAGFGEISPNLERKWVCVCDWVCCVYDWVLVSNFWQFCFCLWLSLFDMIWLSCKSDKPDRTHPPKPINLPVRSDHLNGWSTGWNFANPTDKSWNMTY